MKNRLARLLSVVAFLTVCGLISPVPAAAQSSFGAQTQIGGSISAPLWGPPFGPADSYSRAGRPEGGAGSLSARDSNAMQAFTATQASVARADQRHIFGSVQPRNRQFSGDRRVRSRLLQAIRLE